MCILFRMVVIYYSFFLLDSFHFPSLGIVSEWVKVAHLCPTL